MSSKNTFMRTAFRGGWPVGGERVPAVATPRVAAADAAHREPGAPDRAVGLDRLDGVGRTRRRRSDTVTGPPGEQVLVATDARDCAGARAREGRRRSPVVGIGRRRRESSRAARVVGTRLNSLSQFHASTSSKVAGQGVRTGRQEVGAEGTWTSGSSSSVLEGGPEPTPEAVPLRRRCRPRRATANARRGGCVPTSGGSGRKVTASASGDRARRPDDAARRTCGGHGCARSGRQLVTALEPTRAQHARPARVDIRCRKPWRLARRRLLGW